MKTIEVGNQKEQLINYAWDSRWIHPYESSFGLFQKFMYANALPSKQLYKEFGSSEFRSRKVPLINYKFGDLYTLEGFDNEKICKMLGINLKHGYLNILEHLNNLLGTHLSKYERDLQYCEICLKQGYHSLFHQFKYINQCFIHGTPLLKHYPKCNVSFTYNLHNSKLESPFQCVCNYSFLLEGSERGFYKYWLQQLSVNDAPLVKDIYSLTNIEREQIKRVYTAELPQKDRPQIDVLSTILSHLQQSSQVNTSGLNYTRTRDHIRYIQYPTAPKTSKYNYLFDYDGKEMLIMMYKIYKSISRQIRKILLKKHKICWKYYISNGAFYNEQLCPYVYAYVHWQGEIQGRESYFSPYNKHSKFYFDDFETYSKSDWDYMRKIYEFIRGNVTVVDSVDLQSNRRNSSIVTPNFFVTKWIIGKIYASILLAKFHCWFEIALEYAPKDILFFKAPAKSRVYKERYYPFYSFFLPDKGRDFAEFFLKAQHGSLTDMNPIEYCPNVGNTKQTEGK